MPKFDIVNMDEKSSSSTVAPQQDIDEKSSFSTVAPQQDIVTGLLANFFSSRPDIEQDEILQNGRPMPILRLKTVNRSFQEHWYVKKD